MRAWHVAFGLVLCASEPASAGFVSGNDLWEECSSSGREDTDYMNRAECRGYVKGIADVIFNETMVNGYIACVSAGVNVGQLVDIVTIFLRERPAIRHYAASGLVANALSEAFPCP
jgi:hypothetical protein